MKILTFTLFLFFAFHYSFAQKKPIPAPNKPVINSLKPVSADCAQAIAISVNPTTIYGPTIPPDGTGNTKEINGKQKNTFEEEHNTAWYLLNITKDGELEFEIVPVDTTNDYDFLLYKYTDSFSCIDLQRNKLFPLRSNLSNVKLSVRGVTGIKPNTNKLSIGEGIGNAYSKTIEVKKGEKYILVLDNVHPGGKGHTIYFSYLKKVEIKGKVVGADSIPIEAGITLSDSKGNTVEETKSNIKGEYAFKTVMKENQNYSLTYLADYAFVHTATINTKDLKGTSSFPDIKTVLPKLKKGEKYKLGNINFFGDEAKLLPESYPSVESLYKLMKKNKKMTIQIEGHTNGQDWNLEERNQSSNEKFLSKNRAQKIYDYLLTKGIDKDRISTIGYGSTKILFKNPKGEVQASANRRVEIKVISIE